MLVAGCWLLVTGYSLLVARFELSAGSATGEMALKTKSYRELEIYQLSYELAMQIHRMSLKLPKYELYEEGSQIRRSSKGICSCIVD